MNQPVRSAALPGLPLRPSVSSSTPTEMLLPRGASAATRTVLLGSRGAPRYAGSSKESSTGSRTGSSSVASATSAACTA